MGERCIAIVLAAGQGKRMQSKVQKQFLEIKNHPVLYYSLRTFQNSSLIDGIILVTGADMVDYCKSEIVEKYGFSKVERVIAGGEERYDSVYEGLLACENCDCVFIHDGARPFITEEIIERGWEGVQKSGACVIGMPSKDTVKLSDGKGFVKETPKRSEVWNVQTPQIFRYDLIRAAHDSIRKKDRKNVTDDAMVIEQESGVPVWLEKGSYYNIKITTPEDLLTAEVFMNLVFPND